MQVILAIPEGEFRSALQIYLRRAGIETETAADGLACLERLHNNRPDAIALWRDLRWGGSEGVLAVLRSTVAWSEVPVILLFPSPRDAAFEVHPPVTATATAPFRVTDLARQIFFAATLAKMKATHAGRA